MADTAVSTGELPAQHREHLPRQQPQQPLRRNSAGTHSGASSNNHASGQQRYAERQAPNPPMSDNVQRSHLRPLSLTANREQGGGSGPFPSMGPHPGSAPLARVNSTGGSMRPSAAYDRHLQPHPRLQTAKPSYLQQRATGTPNEQVFNAHETMAGAGSAAYPKQNQAAAANSGGVSAAQGAPMPMTAPLSSSGTPHREVHRASSNEYHHQPGVAAPPPQPHRSSRRMVGPYQLAKTIGAGSMGKVKVALDTRTNMRVAAKIIPLQQPDAPIHFPSGLDTTAATTHSKALANASQSAGTSGAQAPAGPIDPSREPWRTWLLSLAIESRPDLAASAGCPARVQRKLRLLQPRERFTTKDRERRENKDIRIVREVAINRLLFHPHICMLHDVVVHPNHYYIFQELVSGGQMLDYIISHGRLKEKHARKFARQIASAIDYCHHNSIVHRDLKIENILISASGNIKLIDFGLSNLYSPRSHLSTFCGSLYFAAPELLNAQPYIGPEVDLWSFGVVLYVLVCGKVPFDDQSMPALHAKIKRGHVEYPNWLSAECKHLLSRLLVVVPQRRATMGEVTRHPWMCKGYVDHPLVSNHLPRRVPLVSPDQIDRGVVREMSQYIGFGFGTEDEIRIGLEAILTEEWYRNWLKDKLGPQLDVIRAQIQEGIARAQATQAAEQSGSAVGAKDGTPAPAAPLQGSLPLTLLSGDSSSGITLTNPADSLAVQPGPEPFSARLNNANIPGARGAQQPLLAHGAAADAAGGQSEAGQQNESRAGEGVRKRTSFWKRSSTFISGGIGRVGQKAPHDHPASSSHQPAGYSTEKPQPGQFRVLSGRVFNDGKSASSTQEKSASREYPVSPLSAHSPRMYIDSATGMVCLWKDGKLAPPDVDCATIQAEYHDIVATDPLLSIYYLVKERREREGRAAANQSVPDSRTQGQAYARPASQAPAQASVQVPGEQVQPSQPSVRGGQHDSNDVWVKLEKAPARQASLGAIGANGPSSRKSGSLEAQDGSRKPQAALDLAAALAGVREDGRHGAAATTSPPRQPAGALHSGAPSALRGAADQPEPVDLTTAAIEALSSHPRGRASISLAATQGAAGPASNSMSDAKKKRGSIFKRFSVMVKGARSSRKSLDTPSNSSTKVVQAERDESGYMETSAGKDVAGSSSSSPGEDEALARGVGGDASDHSTKPPFTPSVQPAIPGPSSGALKTAGAAHKYTALHSIEEDDEDARDQHSKPAPAAREGAGTPGEPTECQAPTGPATEDPVAASSGQGTETANRIYLNKPLYPASAPDNSKPERRPSPPPADGAPERNAAMLLSETPTAETTPSKTKAPDDGKVPTAAAGTAPADGYMMATASRHLGGSQSSADLDGASSMFTNTDIDESDVITQSSLADHGGSVGYQGFDSAVSGKAALFEKARREIESLDEHEGVGLLDQTPELSYRVPSQSRGASFEMKRHRVRSASNAMVRVLNEIVRDGTPAHGPGSGGQHQHMSKGTLLRNELAADNLLLRLGQRRSSATTPRHSSTGAISLSGAAEVGAKDIIAEAGYQSAAADAALPHATKLDHSPSASTSTSTNPFDAGPRHSALIRSHSHTPGHPQPSFGLPPRIAEVSEPPTPLDAQPTDDFDTAHCSSGKRGAAGAEAGAQDAVASGDAGAAAAASLPTSKDSRSSQQESGASAADAGAGARAGKAGKAGSAADVKEPNRKSITKRLSGLGLDDGSAPAEADVAATIASAPPRADEHLKPVFLKGLFSVSTTSTRSPAAIRAGLLSVLKDMPLLRFHEGKGYFTCSMVTSVGPTNLQEEPLAAYREGDSASKSSGLYKHKSLRLQSVERKLSFRRRPKRAKDAAAAALLDLPPASEDSNSNHLSASRPSIAESNSESAKDQQADPLLVQPPKAASGNAVCFQIFLVRMPLLGLCGLQFRRVSGPTWKYKDICSEILARLKL